MIKYILLWTVASLLLGAGILLTFFKLWSGSIMFLILSIIWIIPGSWMISKVLKGWNKNDVNKKERLFHEAG
jgi:membrane protein implicated in regulation of membrane protease activity